MNALRGPKPTMLNHYERNNSRHDTQLFTLPKTAMCNWNPNIQLYNELKWHSSHSWHWECSCQFGILYAF